MEIDRKELKRRARADMGAAQPPFWAVLLAYLLLTTGVSDLLYLVPLPGDGAIPTTSIFLSVLITLYLSVMSFGLDLWSLWTTRHLDPGVNALFQGFSVAGRVIWLNICVALQITVRLFPAVIALVLFYFLLSPLLLSAPVALICCTIPVMFALYYNIVLRYALAPYLLMDHPERGAAAAVRESVNLMRGWKLELFKLDLSFLGWYLLEWGLAAVVQGIFLLPTLISALQSGGDLNTILTLAAGTTAGAVVGALVCVPVELWLKPYQGLSRAGFYDARQAFTPPPPPVYTYRQ